MFISSLTVTLLACSSPPPAAPAPELDEAAELTPPSDAPPVQQVRAPILCEPGTTAQVAETEKGTEYWCDKGGLMHGAFVRLHESGEKATEGTYVDNLPDGNWIWWHPNGNEESKGKYVKGKQTGSWTTWYDNGNRKEEGDYLQGRRQGTWTSWFVSGAKEGEGIYHNGMKNALWTYFTDSEENPANRTEMWKNGQVVESKDVVPEKSK